MKRAYTRGILFGRYETVGKVSDISAMSIHTPDGFKPRGGTAFDDALARCALGVMEQLPIRVPVFCNESVSCALRRISKGLIGEIRSYSEPRQDYRPRDYDTYEELQRAQRLLTGKGLDGLAIVADARRVDRIRDQAGVIGVANVIVLPGLPDSGAEEGAQSVHSRLFSVARMFNENADLRFAGKL